MHRTLSLFAVASAALAMAPAALAPGADWKPAAGPLMTRWAKEVSPENALPDYPRPQMVRKQWQNLNGLWDYAIGPKDGKQPEAWDGKILVPFPCESALSGVMKTVGPDKRLWYRRTFDVPGDWTGRLLLHFGAVDWDATVLVNGKQVASHRGGYDPFTIDVTDTAKAGKANEIVVSVWDPTDKGYQPRGKQVLNPRGIWYTAVTGIWQTVWLEPVPQAYIRSLLIVPDVDNSQVRITVDAVGAGEGTSFQAASGDMKASAPAGKCELVLKVPDPKLWSPDSPHLYDLNVTMLEGGKGVDSVGSYFGMRKISLGKDASGVLRLMLNGKFVFQIGPLDQGWWPDGLYTAPTDAALRYDVQVTRDVGMNMIRKHVKVEPDRWYTHCDQVGVLVWQDMPSGNGKDGEAAESFDRELKGVLDAFRSHPCIVMWVPFNEGWGQHDTERIAAWIQKYDPSRLVNESSGWTDKGSGDVKDIHSYPGPACPKPEEKRAIVLGEFGGLGLPVKDHLWWDKKNWGYRNFTDFDGLADAYDALIRRLHPLIGRGLSAAVYTQTTDCEGEVNGLMTYDRAMVKIGVERLAKMNARLYLPPPIVKTLLATAAQKAAEWRYTIEKPADGWEKPGFDDSSWKTGKGGFGTEGTPGAVVGTAWRGKDIWIRRTFELKDVPADVQLLIHHDEDAEVYVNGVLAAKATGYTTEYVTLPMRPAAAKSLKAGQNTFAVHCKQVQGGQFIDVGLSQVTEQTK